MSDNFRILDVLAVDWNEPPERNEYGNLVYEASMDKMQYEDEDLKPGTTVIVATESPGEGAIMIVVSDKRKVEVPFSWVSDLDGEQWGMRVHYHVKVKPIKWLEDPSFS